MKSCLLCGAASWGPADPAVAQSFQAMHGPLVQGTPVEKPATDFRMCDNCGVLARLDLLTEPMTAGFEPPFKLIGGPNPLADPFATGLQLMKGIVPERAPETRLERIVRELIRSETVMNTVLVNEWQSVSLAQALVTHARSIEKAMDQEMCPAPATPATPRNFQQDFLSPVLSLTLPGREVAVGLAMDCAIVFGALEAREKGDSFGSVAMLQQAYTEITARLKGMVGA